MKLLSGNKSSFRQILKTLAQSDDKYIKKQANSIYRMQGKIK